jgi:hypothetical protein
MYKTIKGIYKRRQIVPIEPIELNQSEVEVIITFLQEEKKTEDKFQSSISGLLYTMGDRAAQGKLADTSEKHDHYLYGRITEK